MRHVQFLIAFFLILQTPLLAEERNIVAENCTGGHFDDNNRWICSTLTTRFKPDVNKLGLKGTLTGTIEVIKPITDPSTKTTGLPLWPGTADHRLQLERSRNRSYSARPFLLSARSLVAAFARAATIRVAGVPRGYPQTGRKQLLPVPARTPRKMAQCGGGVPLDEQ